MKRVAIVQSNYVPWRGYFDLISSVDEFILLDDVQYAKGSWRNRNRIKTAAGPIWLTIPVHTSGRRRIDEVEIADPGWAERHLKTLAQAYGRAPGYCWCEPWLTELYSGAEYATLSEVNRAFLGRICSELEYRTLLIRSSRYGVERDQEPAAARALPGRRRRRVRLGPGRPELPGRETVRAGGDEGALVRVPGATRPYPQLHPPYEPRLSILDLLLNTGAELSPATCEPPAEPMEQTALAE